MTGPEHYRCCIGCGDALSGDDPKPFCEDCDECARSNEEWGIARAREAGWYQDEDEDCPGGCHENSAKHYGEPGPCLCSCHEPPEGIVPAADAVLSPEELSAVRQRWEAAENTRTRVNWRLIWPWGAS